MRYAPAYTTPRPGVGLLGVVYLVAGGIVAATHHYWENVDTAKTVASALLATILWPLILLGISLHIH
jgi:Na+/proline symporter